MDNPDTLYQQAITYENKQQYHQALECYQKTIECLGKDSDLEYQVYISRGQLKTDLSDFNGAISDFSHLINLYSTRTEAYYQRAIVYDILGKTQEAILDYTFVVHRDKKIKLEALKKRSSLYFIMGNKAQKDQQHEKAIQLFNKALEDDPTNKMAKKHLKKLNP